MSKSDTAPSAAPRTTTNWKAFQDAGLVPVAVKCQAYHPIHLNDVSCHTKVPFSAENLQRHTAMEHGGAFQIYLRKTDGRPAKFWEDLMVSGLEALDFRCGSCKAKLRFHPSSFMAHLKGHRGITRQSYAEILRDQPKAIGMVEVTVGNTYGVDVEETDEYESI
jgi:hypothetical protein